MTKQEQIAVLRQKFQAIQARAKAISETYTPISLSELAQTRTDARRIMELADDAFQACVALLGFPEMERTHNGHLGGKEGA